eukprot:2225078-Amphidinium_carterae.3
MPLSEPEPETSSADDSRSVGAQTFELPVVLPRGVSLALTGCRIYVLWHIASAAFQLPGLHVGPDLSAWHSILHYSAEGRVHTSSQQI